MPRRTPPRTSTARGVRAGATMAAPLVALLVVLGLLGSCTGERPSLGRAKVGGTTTTTTTPTTAPPPEADGPPEASELDPATMLGYIATPTGDPVVRAEPADDALPIEIDPRTPAGAPTTFAIVGDASTPGSDWYQVVLPSRPNEATAWVPASSVTVTKTPFRIFVDLAARRLRVEEDGREVLATTTAIGTEENPTPTGATYVTELIDNNEPDGAYGPYAYGLALHSNTLSEFAGGDGQVGIHGTNQPQLIGQAVSHGCVRLTNGDVQALVDLELPLGVPVFIT
ncbi:MAG: ErfK/YbiS/YcfS/YnhG [Acidimicrobiales bacterium]|nr:ErfK/YbiS/YcfS/YnhG [Acidimicrobiales bacterium]